jgi:ElaB/YqjD/DUF883 family membrane-anchored ribosome-binding protein
MDDDPEVIRNQMEETRSSLTDKIEKLEEKVTATVQNTTAAVTDTVASVKDAVHETVDSVKGTVSNTVETVKDVFDVPGYFRDYPWAAFGASVAVGFAGGTLLGTGVHARGDRITDLHSRGQPVTATTRATHGPSTSHNGGPKKRAQAGSFTASPAHATHGLVTDIASKFGDEIGKLKGVALGAVFGLVRDWIGRSAPGEVSQRLGQVIDDVTRKLGGEPIKGNLMDSFTGQTGDKANRERDEGTQAGHTHRFSAQR